MRSVALLACAALIIPATVFAQAGSTGGTIGKTDKSIYGGEERSKPQRAPEGKRSAVANEKPTANSCQKIVGRWAWNSAWGTSETVFRSDGTGQNSGGWTNAWTCADGVAIVKWFNHSDRVTVSRDGNSLSILNPDGQFYSATRK
jgi:hypothetical protein